MKEGRRVLVTLNARSQRAYTRMLTDRSCINVRFTPQCGHHSLGTHAKRSSIQDENASYDPRCKQAEEAGRIVALAARSPFRAYPAPIFAIPGNHDSFVVPGTPDDQKPLITFQRNFCAEQPVITPEAGSLHRTAMTQPVHVDKEQLRIGFHQVGAQTLAQ